MSSKTAFSITLSGVGTPDELKAIVRAAYAATSCHLTVNGEGNVAQASAVLAAMQDGRGADQLSWLFRAVTANSNENGTPINATLNHAPRQPRAYDDWSRDGSAAYAQTTPAASPKHEMPKPNKSGWTPDKLGWGRSNVY